jgi:hypothetical protein
MEENLSFTLDNHRTLWLTEICRAAFDEQQLDALGDDNGVFVVLEDTQEGKFEILAKAASIWAGEALMEVFARTLPSAPQLSLVR